MFSYTWQRDLLLEFACQIWSPKCRYLIDKIESVQDFLLENYTAFVISYLDRVHVLGLETLEHRRLIGHDLVLCYKYLHGLIDTDNRNFWCVQLSARTMKQCHTHSFMHRWLLFTNLVCLCIPCLRPLIGVSIYVGFVAAENGAPFLFRPQIVPEQHFRNFLNSIQQMAPPIFGGRPSRWS